MYIVLYKRATNRRVLVCYSKGPAHSELLVDDVDVGLPEVPTSLHDGIIPRTWQFDTDLTIGVKVVAPRKIGLACIGEERSSLTG